MTKVKEKKVKAFRIGTYLKPFKWLLFFGPFTKALEAATEVIIPVLMAKIIDVGIANNDTKYIYTYAGIILGLNLLGIIFAIISQKCSTLTGEGVAKNIRRDMYAHINTYSYSELDGFSAASLVNRTINDVNQVEHTVTMTMRLVTRIPFLLIGSFVMALIIDLQLSLIFLAVIPIIAIVMFIMTKKTFPYYEKYKVELDNLSNITRENLSGVRVVRAFNKQDKETERFENSNNTLSSIDSKVVRITSVLQPIIFMVVNFSVLALVYWGGVRVNIGSLSTGNVIAFINYFTQISGALVTVARMIITYTRTSAASKRINDVLSVENSIKEKSKTFDYDTEKNKRKGASVSFENVSFAYGANKETIKNLSFELAAGETLGIIGGTGSGKSTIINLIPRLYDTTHGNVKIDGVSVKDYKTEDLRKIVGYCPQNVLLFEGTIESNLKWRKSDATNEELIKALRISQSYEFVKEKPKFLQAKVTRGGTNFSGGQKQRLTIARALVGNPRILILDDSASALDLATDARLRHSLSKSMPNVTKILVSQRATSLMHADKIIVMDKGVAVDIGTHDELLGRCKLYQEIYNSQSSKAEEDRI